MPRFLDRVAQAACWAARIAGLLLALLFFAFVIGEGLPHHWPSQFTAQFTCLSAIAAGLLVAWKWEALGGAITLAAFGFLCLANPGFVSFARWSPFTSIPVAVALVHLLCWLRLRGASPGKLPVALWTMLGIFAALCANEIFGAPPLMTPNRPAASVVGAWHAGGIFLNVAPDGALSGMLDGHPLGDARLAGNRSWFGKLLKWRTDYIVTGSNIHGFLWLDGARLMGDLTLPDAGKHRFEVVR